MLVDTALSIIIFEQQPELIESILRFEHLDSIPKRLSAYFMRSMSYVEYFCMMQFVLTRTFEHKLLNFFIIYQQNFRLENLNVAKDTYQKLELKFKKVHRAVCIGIGIPYLVYCIFRLFNDKSYYLLMGIHIYSMGATVFVMSYY